MSAVQKIFYISHISIVSAIMANNPAFSKGVVILDTNSICSIKINGLSIKNAKIEGRQDALKKFFSHDTYTHVHSCQYLLLGKKMSETEYVIDDIARPAPSSVTILPSRIRVVFSKKDEFLDFISSAMHARHPPPSPPPHSPAAPEIPLRKDRQNFPGSVSHDANPCSLEGICLTRDRALSADVSCGPISVTATTNGAVAINFSMKSHEIIDSFRNK